MISTYFRNIFIKVKKRYNLCKQNDQNALKKSTVILIVSGTKIKSSLLAY